MEFGVTEGILIPFIGTVLGAGCVFLMNGVFSRRAERVLTGAAAGVMTAASVWSLLIPATEQSSAGMGRLAFLPAVTGFLAGIAALMLLDRVINRVTASGTGRPMMLLAVTLHNIPEGMAVGAVYAGLVYGSSDIAAAEAAALAIGIAIQNFPEGAIISMPLHAGGTGRLRSFLLGAASGAVEPIAALVTVAAAGLIVPAMPYLLSFAAGAMIYVTVADMIPETASDRHNALTAVTFSIGFAVMMSLDVALG